MVGSTVASLTGDWRWGLRVTPILNLVALILMVVFMVDPERGKMHQFIMKSFHCIKICVSGASESHNPKKSANGRLSGFRDDMIYLFKNRLHFFH